MAGTSTAALTQTSVTIRRSRTLNPGRFQTVPKRWSLSWPSRGVGVAGGSATITRRYTSSALIRAPPSAPVGRRQCVGVPRRRREQGRGGRCRPVGEDADVLGEQLAGDG